MGATTLSHHYATVNGVKLHYVRQGAGEPLLLIHGWPGFWFEWHRNIDALARHYDVIVPDMRGYAYSDKPDLPPETGYTDTVFAEDIHAFCEFYHLDKVRIVSHDFGAIWVQRFARMYPERLHKLMLFDPPYPGIGARWFQLPHVFNVWYQMFHLQPWAEDLVGSSREATRIYISHFLSAWSADKDLLDAGRDRGVRRGVLTAGRAARRLQLLSRGVARRRVHGRRQADHDADEGAVGRQRRDPAVRVVG